MGFAEAWRVADKIPGWLSEAEGKALYDAAMESEGTIVEIGTFKGRSTSLLAATGRPVVTIDPLGAEIDSAPNVTRQTCTSNEATWPAFTDVGMVFIDGQHDEGQPARDMAHAASVLRKGGTIAFHDYGTEADVYDAVARGLNAGLFGKKKQVGSLWVGEMGGRGQPSVYLARPHSGSIHHACIDCGYQAVDGKHQLYPARSFPSSLLCWIFNGNVAACRNAGCDYFAMLHSDIQAPPGWASQLIDDMEEVGADIIHAPCAIKDDKGLTSTAVAESRDHIRRLTVTELLEMPELFTTNEVDGILLPNTGCMVMKCDDWFWYEFRFHMEDTIQMRDGLWRSRVIPEDWMMGFDAHKAHKLVACTRAVETIHYDGNTGYGCTTPGDWETDRDVLTTEAQHG